MKSETYTRHISGLWAFTIVKNQNFQSHYSAGAAGASAGASAGVSVAGGVAGFSVAGGLQPSEKQPRQATMRVNAINFFIFVSFCNKNIINIIGIKSPVVKTLSQPLLLS